jgi:hypothetical protein
MSADGGAGDLGRGWTPARTALVITHFDAGLSAAESAVLIGDVSKSAVISKRRRLGLFAAVADGERPVETRRPHWPRSRLSGGRPRRPPPLRVYPLPEMDLPPPPDAAPKPLTAKAARECAWPLGRAEAEGDYRTLFCCAPRPVGAVYCAVHAARAYQREG